MTLARKFLILSHRYLGIAVSLLVVMWFATGLVMMYAGGMPRLSPEQRLERLAPVDLSQVRLTPSQALEKADIGPMRGQTLLLTVEQRPAYRFGETVVFADTGEVMEETTIDQARAAAARFLNVPESQVRYVRTLDEVDQWTLVNSRQLPLYKFAVDDGSATELYIQPATQEVVMMTTRKSRALAWAGVIPHWLYFTALRESQPLWYRIMVWTSAAACVLAVLGLLLAATLFRKTTPFRPSAAIPYKGWMRWHYITGAVFGFFTLTWAFSGLLSMEPFAWTNADGLQVRRDTFTGGPVDLAAYASVPASALRGAAQGRAVKEIAFTRIDGRHYYEMHLGAPGPVEEKLRERLHQPYYVYGRADSNRVLVDAETLAVRERPVPVETLLARLAAALPDQRIVEHELLTEYDNYYYSRASLTPLPVLRVKFADPAESWVYIDPEMGQVLSSVSRMARLERWLYSGLHNLDFFSWHTRRPLWDIAMIVLCLGGLASSTIGTVLGFRRVLRGAARLPRALVPAADEVAGGTPSRSLHR
jgi:uncharacterized iron-regulated membrane protein